MLSTLSARNSSAISTGAPSGGQRYAARVKPSRRATRISAWLGLVPRQATTGGKPMLLGITKRGNKYLRKLLIHGARAALPHIAERDTALGRWAKGLLAQVHQNVAVVALANKLARIVWAVLRRG
jgi:transposase